jgi:hypothetical protein
MKWWKYKKIYASGSSLTAGGGMNDEMNKREYKRLLGIDIGDEKNFTYPKYIADHFKCELIHDAQSGSGAPRLIRRAYNYIQKNGIEESRKTLFLFEITDPIHRVDFYIDDIGDYVIVNVRYDNDGNNGGNISSIQIQQTTTYDGIFYSEKDLEKYVDQIKIHLQKFHNPVVYTKKFIGEIAGLFSFLEENEIDYLYQFDNHTLWSPFNDFYGKISNKELRVKNYDSINQFAGYQNLTVKDDLKGFTTDLHPGVYGHKLFAEETIKIIEKKLKPKLFVFGDSHTQSFKSHIEANMSWAVEYHKYLNKIPKNYDEIIGEYFDIEVVNNGKGGCSNQNIFDTFLETRRFLNIQPKDMLVFGWTSEGRFRVANEVNEFSDTIPFNHHAPQNDDVPKNVTDTISLNKVSYNVWWKEIINYIDIIKELQQKNENIYHWSWVDSDTVYSDRIWSKEMLDDNRLCIYFTGWEMADEELKNIIIKNNDVIYDFSFDVNLNELKDSILSGKKVTIINVNKFSKELIEFLQINGLRTKLFKHNNYKKECFNSFFTQKKYTTIFHETNGSVDDLHTSEIGHRELAEDLIKKITNDDKKTLL